MGSWNAIEPFCEICFRLSRAALYPEDVEVRSLVQTITGRGLAPGTIFNIFSTVRHAQWSVEK